MTQPVKPSKAPKPERAKASHPAQKPVEAPASVAAGAEPGTPEAAGAPVAETPEGGSLSEEDQRQFDAGAQLKREGKPLPEGSTEAAEHGYASIPDDSLTHQPKDEAREVSAAGEVQPPVEDATKSDYDQGFEDFQDGKEQPTPDASSDEYQRGWRDAHEMSATSGGTPPSEEQAAADKQPTVDGKEAIEYAAGYALALSDEEIPNAATASAKEGYEKAKTDLAYGASLAHNNYPLPPDASEATIAGYDRKKAEEKADAPVVTKMAEGDEAPAPGRPAPPKAVSAAEQAAAEAEKAAKSRSLTPEQAAASQKNVDPRPQPAAPAARPAPPLFGNEKRAEAPRPRTPKEQAWDHGVACARAGQPRPKDDDAAKSGYDAEVRRLATPPDAVTSTPAAVATHPTVPPDPASKPPTARRKVSIGRDVHYVLSQSDAEQINRRRTNAQSIASRIKAKIQGETEDGIKVDGALWPIGAQAHIGNEAKEGQHVPMKVVVVWSEDTGCLNGQVFLDGNDTFWAMSRSEDASGAPGTWHWPEIV